METNLILLSSEIGKLLEKKKLTITTAESCTGGLLSHILTGVSGSSSYFLGGVVAYSNRIKQEILGVKAKTLNEFGAVSSETALEMANGAREKFRSDIGLSTTGIAGPTGGTPAKPVGLVWIGISTPEKTWTFKYLFDGDRQQVKANTVEELLILLLNHLKQLE